MEDLERYLDQIVEPTIADFEANPTSRRHAFLACVTAFHTIDYLAFPRKSRSLRQRFNKESQSFAVVDQVAHAFKHVVSGHEASPRQTPLKAADVILRPPAFWGVARWNLSRWGDPKGGVTLIRHRNVDLLGALREAVEFLRAQQACRNPSSEREGAGNAAKPQ